MATIWNETFEAVHPGGWAGNVTDTHYDNTYNLAETITTLNTLNADTATAVSGWGSQCLRVVAVANATNAYVAHELAGDNAKTYTRIEVYPITFPASSATEYYILQICNKAWAPVWNLAIYHDGTDRHFKINAKYDGANHYFYSDNPISLNTKYCVEVFWDNTGNTWLWKIDGVDQGDGTAVTADYSLGAIVLGIQGGFAGEYYVDSFNINDTAFLGPTAGGQIPYNPWHQRSPILAQ